MSLYCSLQLTSLCIRIFNIKHTDLLSACYISVDCDVSVTVMQDDDVVQCAVTVSTAKLATELDTATVDDGDVSVTVMQDDDVVQCAVTVSTAKLATELDTATVNDDDDVCDCHVG